MARADGSIVIDTRVDTKGIQEGSNQIQGMFKKLSSGVKKIGATIAAAFAVKEIVEFSKTCIELGSNLEEVQNVVDVTFGDLAGKIDDFARSAARQFGMSELSAKQYTSTMGAMLKSMGFATDEATEMSIAMAGLAGDMASFYNLETDEAFAKIRSGMSGETEPLKQLGINLSETNLEQYRLAQGIEVSYRNMSQMDKALLRYNYLLSTTNDAQGDFARTSGSWANQMKILKLQIQSIMADLGQGLINLLIPVLKMINAVLEGVAKLASAFKAFTALITGKKADTSASVGSGISDTASDYTDAAAAADDYADATESAADATRKANKEAQRYASGLDKIHKYQTASSDSASSSGGSKKKSSSSPTSGSVVPMANVNFGALETGETVVDGLAAKMKKLYDYILKVTEPVRKSLANLWNNGLQKLGQFTGKALEDFYNSFLVPVGSWVMGTGLPRFIDALNDGLMKINWSKINDGLKAVWDQLAPFAVKIGEGLLWFWENVLVPLGTWVGNNVVPRFLDAVATVVRILNAVIDAAAPIYKWFWEDFLKPIAKWTGGIILKVWDGIIGALKTFAQWCEDNVETAHKFAESVAKAWQNIKKWVVDGVKNIKTNIENFFKTVGTLWSNGWNNIKTFAQNAWAGIKNSISTAWNAIKTTTSTIWNAIKASLTTVWNAIKTSASQTWNNLKQSLSTVWNSLKTVASTAFNGIKTTIGNVWSNVKSAASSAWSGIRSTLTGAWNSLKTNAGTAFGAIKTKIDSVWNDAKAKTTTVWNGIKTTITNVFSVISEKLGTMKQKISDAFVGAFNGIVRLIKTPINGVISAINGIIKGVVTGINAMIGALNHLHFSIPSWVPALGGRSFGLNIPKITNYPRIPLLAQGAVIPPNAPFAAVLGDQKKGTNIEAPESLIRKIFREEAGKNGRYEFKAVLNRRVLFDEIIDEAKLRQRMSAVNPFDLA